MKSAFTGTNAYSGRKVLLAGSELTALLNKISYTRVAQASDKVTHWGIDFSEIRSKFGSLYVIHAEVFDQCGHEYDGLVIDPEYLVKYVHVPFKVERLDLRKSASATPKPWWPPKRAVWPPAPSEVARQSDPQRLTYGSHDQTDRR